jgi:hypothetical protein
MVTTMTPPGWYSDPTTRHAYRYWDGAAWTPQVSDAGVTTTDPLTARPDGSPVVGPSVQASVPGRAVVATGPRAGWVLGFRAVAVSKWRAGAVRIAMAAALIALVFEGIALVALNAAVSNNALPTRSTLQWASWLYHYSVGDITYAYAPPLLFLGLLLSAVLFAAVLVNPRYAVRKAVGRRTKLREPSSRCRSELHKMGAAATLLRERGQRVLLVVAELGALLVTGISAYAVIAKEGVYQESGRFTGALSVGLGPKVCLVAGIVGVISGLVAWPWRAQREVSVLPSGSVADNAATGQPD